MRFAHARRRARGCVVVALAWHVRDAQRHGSPARLRAECERKANRADGERFPGFGAWLEEETTVAIDGELHETGYLQPLREGCEIFFLPKIEAG